MDIGSEIEPAVITKTDANGLWSLALEESANIDPASSYYRVREMAPKAKGGARTWFFRVPVNDSLLHDCLIQPTVANAIIKPTVVTSTSRPATPYIGQMIFEADTGKVLWYYGSTLGWQYNWWLAWGEVANMSINAANFTTTSTTYVDVTGLSNASLFTAINGRRYLTTINAFLGYSGSTGATINTAIKKADGTSYYRDQSYLIQSASGWNMPMYYESRDAESGVVGRRLMVNNAAGGTITIYASATHPALLSVYDIGPSAAPVIT